jgi:hypothetical protein
MKSRYIITTLAVPETKVENRVYHIHHATVREYSIPCSVFVIPVGVAADNLATDHDVLDALGDDVPDLALRAAKRAEGLSD